LLKRYHQLLKQFFGFLLLVVGIIEYLGLWAPVQRVIFHLALPFLQRANRPYQVVGSWVDRWQSGDAARIRLRELERLTAQTSAQLTELERLQQENVLLQQALARKGESVESLHVFTRPILSHGVPSVVVTGTPVRAGAGVLAEHTLIGRVGEQQSNIAPIVLLSDLGSAPLLVVTEHGVTGVVVGDGQRVVLEHIPAGAELAIGDRVMTVTQEGIPSGILVGRLRSVHQQPSAAEQSATIDQFVSFYRTTFVEVLP
jgi:cell shape-determining protein MreC